ncbi:MAG: fatty acid desaturase [Chitinophagaceae bacterium]|nr:fatty acid desaturase [Chitinophagaceae bacterium]
MLTGKQLILATKPYAQEQRSKSWYVLFSTLFFLLAAAAGTIWGHYIVVRLASSVLMSLLMMRMFIIYHDFEHHAILQKSLFAKIIMSAYGLYMLTPASIWKRSHDYHHKNNSKLFSASIGSYPIATKKKFASMTKGERRAYLANRHPLVILFGYFTIFIFGMCIASFASTPKKHWDSLIALILHVALAASVFFIFDAQTLLFTIIVPFTITCAIGSYLFYAQHNFPGVLFNSNEDWTYERAALESSSYMRTNKVMAWFSGNIGYHHIHHLNARIPFYRLPEAYHAIKELQAAKQTSLKISDMVKCFRLKIWDPEVQRMISLKEYKMSLT